MTVRRTYPTPYPDVNGLLDRLLAETRAILGDQFVGMYLHGSLAAGDFDPGRSDIDFLVVTGGKLPDEMLEALAAMHQRVAASDLKWNTNYEGSYIPQQAIRRYDPADSVHPAVNVEGDFGLDYHGGEWVVQRHIVREHGIVVAGPDPATLIDPVSPDALREGTRGVLQVWWAPKLRDHTALHSSEYQAYTVLTMCRALYTVECGAVASKPQAAAWAQEHLGAEWAGLIKTAMAWRHGVEMDRLDEVLAFLRYALERAAISLG